MSEDPIQSGLNWYTYCYNNPIRFYDPSGLEQIVVSGGAYHPDNGSPYQYEFVDSALLQISNLGGDATLLMTNAGWTETQYNAIVQAAADRSINLVWFSNTDELTNYINTGGINGSGNRANDPITDFYVFAHGTDSGTGNYAITFGLYTNKDEQLSWSTGDISSINSSAFSSSAVSKFYACRTGNTFSTGNFAQTWADKTGGDTYAYYGAFGKTDVGRSNYANINGNKFVRHGIFASKGYRAWAAKRGPVEARPGEAWALPQASYLTSMGCYGTVPTPVPGPALRPTPTP